MSPVYQIQDLIDIIIVILSLYYIHTFRYQGLHFSYIEYKMSTILNPNISKKFTQNSEEEFMIIMCTSTLATCSFHIVPLQLRI